MGGGTIAFQSEEDTSVDSSGLQDASCDLGELLAEDRNDMAILHYQYPPPVFPGNLGQGTEGEGSSDVIVCMNDFGREGK